MCPAAKKGSPQERYRCHYNKFFLSGIQTSQDGRLKVEDRKCGLSERNPVQKLNAGLLQISALELDTWPPEPGLTAGMGRIY
jgi:hypothetical protein